jgi:hypothetical protein
MGHSVIAFRDRRELLHDNDLRLVTQIACAAWKSALRRPYLTNRVQDLLEVWSRLPEEHAPGCLDLRLDEFVKSDEDVRCLREVLDLGRQTLDQFGAVVPGAFLDSVFPPSEQPEFFDRPLSDLLESFNRVESVLLTPAAPR